MLDKRTLHMKVQEQCDCFATTDPLIQMAALKGESDPEEGALKWMALAVLHGINANAKKIRMRRAGSGDVTVTAKNGKAELPSPGAAIGAKIIDVVKGITHIEGEKGKMPVVIGIRDGSIEVQVKFKQSDEGEEVVIKFPE
ncbi:MAG: hypothetical protein ABFD97_13255 [Syntrophobacter sp.]